MNIKYQIFVSSTYEDLKEEREQVIKACLQMGHIPVGMEMFNASDEDQWKIIARQIESSDYYVVIVGHRYGSVTGGLSYTEKEYDYALECGVPTLGFIIKDGASWPVDRIDTKPTPKKRLKEFKQKVCTKPVDFWCNAEQLHGHCVLALSKAFNTVPRPGWVRSSDVPGPQVATEISRLSGENSLLRSELERYREEDDSSFAQGDDLASIEVKVNPDRGYRGSQPLTQIKTLSWRLLFREVAEALLQVGQEDDIERVIIRKWFSELEDDLDPSDLYIAETSWSLLKAQFLALGYITINHIAVTTERTFLYGSEKEPFTEMKIVWILTPKGQRAYGEIAAAKRA